jgi:hypothetical protein
MGLQVSLQRYDVQVLGRRFQCAGQMEPVGPLLDYLNKGNRSTFPMFDVKLMPIESAGPLTAISRPEIILSAQELGVIYFLDSEYRRQVQMLRQFDRIIAYTPHAVLRGNFHRGAETRLRDLLDMLSGAFLAMTEVSIFPTTSLPGAFPQQADLLVVNRLHVQFYHSD